MNLAAMLSTPVITLDEYWRRPKEAPKPAVKCGFEKHKELMRGSKFTTEQFAEKAGFGYQVAATTLWRYYKAGKVKKIGKVGGDPRNVYYQFGD